MSNENRTPETPVPSTSGQLVGAPDAVDLKPTANSDAPTEAAKPDVSAERAQRQFLTGRAARELDAKASLTPFQLAWRELRKNRWAMTGGFVLIGLYLMALFAPFIAPYDPIDKTPAERITRYHPPMKLRWVDTNGQFSLIPFVYGTVEQQTEFREIIYLPDAKQKYPLRFFVRGDEYRLFGLIPSNIHLFGTDAGGAIFLLGTDEPGRDYFSRLMYGSQISLSIGLIAIFITFTLGMLIGGISGFYGGRIDEIIMRGSEIIMSVPDFYLLLALAAALPPDMDPIRVYLLIIVILSFVGWAGMARIIRGMVLSVREREYVEAARSLGVNDITIVVRHILPSTFTYAIVAATLSIPGYILGETGLSFLGLGIRDPMASWGNMLSAALSNTVLQNYPWILAPGVMIFITTLAFNFLGDGLRDALDPKSRR
jgi:peptide/nickel transport system permease protein